MSCVIQPINRQQNTFVLNYLFQQTDKKQHKFNKSLNISHHFYRLGVAPLGGRFHPVHSN